MKTITTKTVKDRYGSWCYTKDQIRNMDTKEIKRHIKRHFRWSRGEGEFYDDGTLPPEKHKPMPYSPSTFRYLVLEAMTRISK